jgi:RNA polymerase sigma-70 factor (ECF subfamily)
MTEYNRINASTTSYTQDIQVWIAQSIAGNQEAYHKLYNHFADGVYRLCHSLLPTPQDAEDVMQESFVYAFKNLARYDAEKSSFKTWLYTIAVSRCRNTYRRKRLPTIDISRLLQWNLAAPKADSPEAAMARQDAHYAIKQALQELSPSMREAVVLRYGHGLTYREIADVMGCPQKTAESRVRLAHQKLRQQLAAVGPGLLEELLRI